MMRSIREIADDMERCAAHAWDPRTDAESSKPFDLILEALEVWERTALMSTSTSHFSIKRLREAFAQLVGDE